MGVEESAVHRAAERVRVTASGGGKDDGGGVPQSRDQRGIVLRLAQEVRGAAAVRDEAAEAARRGKPASEEASRRPVAGQRDAAGRDPPENMKPARKREMADDIRGAWQVSIRGACQVLPVDRSPYHYRPKPPGQAVFSKRSREIAGPPVGSGNA